MPSKISLTMILLCMVSSAMAQVSATPGGSDAGRLISVSTADEIKDLFRLAEEEGIRDTEQQFVYLAYENEQLRQYAKITFGTVVFIQSRTAKTGQRFDEIDHWIITAGLDGHLVSARHDQVVEEDATVLTIKDLSNDDDEAVSAARGIIDRFLGLMLWASVRPPRAIR